MREVERTHFVPGVSPRQLFEIVTDYERYPSLFPEFSKVRIVEKRPGGVRVEFKAKMIKEFRYVLDIEHDDAGPELKTRWTFVEGEILSDSRGGWTLRPEGDGTRIDYRAGIDVNIPAPGFIVTRISEAILGQSIPNMFRALERAVRGG